MRRTPLPLKSLPHCRSCHAYGSSQHRSTCNPDVPCRIALGTKPLSAVVDELNDRARLSEDDELPVCV